MSFNPGRTCLAIVLAAGEGTRMQSARPKVLHALAGRSMLAHCMASVATAGADRIAVVVGPGREDVAAEAKSVSPGASVFVQAERRGTAHAVLAAEAAIAEGYDYVLIVFADTPLIKSETLRQLRLRAHDAQAAVAALGFEARDPTGYGRFLVEGEKLIAIREEKDASPDERRLTLVNAGLMALDGRTALDLLKQIDTDNAKGEFYLTDVVAAAASRGLASTISVAGEDEVLGVNDRIQLARAEAVLQTRLRDYAMRGGATLIDPASVTLAYDTVLGRDVTVEPHVVFAPGVRVADGVTIRSFSHLEGVTVGPRATIGPFARLRPGSVLHEDVHVGNFVEIKASTLEAGVKANHLSYIGDASVGAKTNIGAGTITCNYNGFQKFKTTIGAGAFIGVNSALVAPVTIGDGAYIGTGSVVTRDVAPDALVVARAPQVEKPGWAKMFRDKNKR
ncbi:MAG: bifunctional UDP-N-acetylglucosamine diphosphorylase/glucosamine-1-phosphate N-acetyltransferase GlmU [Beijerinckiaceae bacterium]|nr:bifunctional UDP-N-acetylglucosamine diphosphorylase/glucosamine-1-phosphate N-acetyltransferase GlmU [Beijerinckiaceae bacterium]